MHIVLGVLGTLVTLLILFKRLSDAGIDLGWLNPFLWHRRRTWRKKYEADPLHSLDKPMEIAAALMFGTAMADGAISTEQKTALLAAFRDQFHLAEREATQLLGSTAFVIKDGEELRAKLRPFLQRTREHLKPEQVRSTIELCNAIAGCDGSASAAQLQFLDAVRAGLAPNESRRNAWA
ncbi:MAG: tellurite resistance TerB family protein [Gammaproteobacteria bacterium]